MNATEIGALLDRTLELLAARTEELRDLDAAVGDGDLGITVGKGCEAARERIASLVAPTPALLLRSVGAAAANANPSTMAALIGGATMAAAKTLGESSEVGRSEAIAIGRAMADSIATRGKSAVGDKTILDALVPAIAALAAASEDESTDAILDAMVAAARDGVESTTSLQNRRGRAAWLGERSAGHPDPGAVACLRFLESLAAAHSAGAR